MDFFLIFFFLCLTKVNYGCDPLSLCTNVAFIVNSFISLSTSLCLRYKPEVTAVAMIALAAKFNNHDLQASSTTPGKPWFHSFTKGIAESVIEGTVNFLLQCFVSQMRFLSISWFLQCTCNNLL